MKHAGKVLLGMLLLMAGGLQIACSQSFTNSPYSRFGLGELQYGGFAQTISMGGVYNALQNDTTAPFHINTLNPASHASARITVFDFGVRSNFTRLETTDKQDRSNQTALSHMAILFPVTKWWGASIGLLPYSSVGYNIHEERAADSIGSVKYSYEGQGGVSQVFFGNGFRIKNLFLGANISYLFGDMMFSSRDSFPQGSNYFNTKYTQTTRVSDLYSTFGMQFRIRMKKNWTLTLGATGGLKSDLIVKQSSFGATYVNNLGLEQMKDTIINEKDAKGTITIPMMLGGGFVLKRGEKWMLGADYSVQNWSAFSSPDGGALKDSRRITIGLQYVPNKNAGTKEPYFKKIYYRAGLRYADSYLNLNNTDLKDYAVTLGAGFPLRRVKVGETYSQSIINLAAEIGRFGTTDNNLIRQNYVKLLLSFTLNDRWFIKRKYD